MLNLPDRRHFLSTLAGASALGAAAVPALAKAPGPVEAMWPEYLRLEAALDDATISHMDAEDRYEEPARPSWHPFIEEGGYVSGRTGSGHLLAFLDDGEKNVAWLRECIARELEPDAEDAGTTNRHRAERARNTLAKIENWQAEVDRRQDAAGLPSARARNAQALKALKSHVDAMLAIEAGTYREAAFQAAALRTGWAWDQDAAARVLARLAELAGLTSDDA